jgi:hypothetical protein
VAELQPQLADPLTVFICDAVIVGNACASARASARISRRSVSPCPI